MYIFFLASFVLSNHLWSCQRLPQELHFQCDFPQSTNTRFSCSSAWRSLRRNSWESWIKSQWCLTYFPYTSTIQYRLGNPYFLFPNWMCEMFDGFHWNNLQSFDFDVSCVSSLNLQGVHFLRLSPAVSCCWWPCRRLDPPWTFLPDVARRASHGEPVECSEALMHWRRNRKKMKPGNRWNGWNPQERIQPLWAGFQTWFHQWSGHKGLSNHWIWPIVSFCCSICSCRNRGVGLNHQTSGCFTVWFHHGCLKIVRYPPGPPMFFLQGTMGKIWLTP